MEGTNWILLNADTVREALEDYLNKHARPGQKFSVDSWGMQRFNTGEWCTCEVTEQPSASAAGGE